MLAQSTGAPSSELPPAVYATAATCASSTLPPAVYATAATCESNALLPRSTRPRLRTVALSLVLAVLSCTAQGFGQELIRSETEWSEQKLRRHLVAFSNDDRLAAVTDVDFSTQPHSHSIKIHEVATWKVIAKRTIRDESEVQTFDAQSSGKVAFLPSGSELVLCDQPRGQTTVWDIASDATRVVSRPPLKLRSSNDAPRPIYLASLSHDGSCIVLSEPEKNRTVIRVQRLDDGEILLEDVIGDWIARQAMFNQDGSAVFAVGERYDDRKKRFSLRVYRWDLQSGKLTKQWGPFPLSGTRVRGNPRDFGHHALSPDGQILATTQHGNFILLTEVATGRTQVVGPHPGNRQAVATFWVGTPDCDVAWFAFAPGQNLLATGAIGSPIVRLWPTGSGGEAGQLEQPDTLSVQDLVSSPSGQLLGVTCMGNKPIWDWSLNIWRLSAKTSQ